MKLYLSSYRVPVPDALFELLPKSPMDCKVAIIPNAKDYKLPHERAESLDDLMVHLGGWGFSCEEVDLREYEDPELLKRCLLQYDAIWAAGGNTFMLRYEMKHSGFDQIIYELLQAGIVYCGESAGAIVAGTTLEGAEIEDEPELADEVINEGLGLIPHVVVVHDQNTELFAYLLAMHNKYDGDPTAIFLSDEQACVVQGQAANIVSSS